MSEPQLRRLPNGLRLVLLPMPHLQAVSLAVAVRCGARHEAADAWGLSHLLEHMLFRGSRLHRSTAALMGVFEAAGGALDAGTWRDHTHYSTQVAAASLPAVLRALGGMLAAPRFADLDIERAIVGEELAADADEAGQPAGLTDLSRACLWRDHALGRGVAGSPQSIAPLTRAHLRAHHRRHYGARNTVLCVCGPFDPASLLQEATRCLGQLPPGAPTDDGPPVRCYRGCLACVREFAAPQISLQLSYPALPDDDPDFLAARLLVNLLDDGLTTRLPQALCVRRGLVYDLSSGLDCYADVGLFDVEMHLAPQRAREALDVVAATLGDLCRVGVRPAEWRRTQDRWIHQAAFRRDDGEALAQQLAAQALFHPDAPLLDVPEAVRRIGRADLLRVARRLFAADPPHLTALGPVQEAGLRGVQRVA